MSGLTQCIMHSNIAEIIHHLDDMLSLNQDGESRGILLLLGLPKTGKDRIIRYWKNREHWDKEKRASVEMPPVASLEVWKAQADSLGRKVYVKPITCVTFSELVYGLGQIAAKYVPSYAGKHWYRQPKALYTDGQFMSLFSFVRDEVRRLRIRVIVINNAHYINDNTLEMLMLLRRHCGNQIAFVLVAQLAENADIDEPLAEAFRRMPEAEAICRKIVLQRLTKKEYKKAVLPGLAEDLNLFFADDLQVAAVAKEVPNALWRYTRFDWKLIDDLARTMKLKVPEPRNGGPRVISRAVLEGILGQPIVVEPAPQEKHGEPPSEGGEDIPF